MLRQEESANTPPMRCHRKTTMPLTGRWASMQCHPWRTPLRRPLRKRTRPGVFPKAQSSRFQNYRCRPPPTSPAATYR